MASASCSQLLFSKMTVGPMMSRVITTYKTFVPSVVGFLSLYKYSLNLLLFMYLPLEGKPQTDRYYGLVPESPCNINSF